MCGSRSGDRVVDLEVIAADTGSEKVGPLSVSVLIASRYTSIPNQFRHGECPICLEINGENTDSSMWLRDIVIRIDDRPSSSKESSKSQQGDIVDP